jgi:hypothetical protein
MAPVGGGKREDRRREEGDRRLTCRAAVEDGRRLASRVWLWRLGVILTGKAAGLASELVAGWLKAHKHLERPKRAFRRLNVA